MWCQVSGHFLFVFYIAHAIIFMQELDVSQNAYKQKLSEVQLISCREEGKIEKALILLKDLSEVFENFTFEQCSGFLRFKESEFEFFGHESESDFTKI